MQNLLTSELLLWGGIAAMAISIGVGMLCMTVSFFMGRKLKKKLEVEYGKPQR